MLAINSVNLYKQPHFGSYFNEVKDDNGKLKYRGDTCMCRLDLYTPEVVDFLEEKYKNTQEVKIVAHACSNGEEIYSFWGTLKARLGLKANKFRNVIAKDIDPSHIALAQKGEFYIRKDEYNIANDYMNGKFSEYFDTVKNTTQNKKPAASFRYCETPIKVTVKDDLKKDIKFEFGNILDDAKRIDFKNTVLLARNFWPYLDSKDADNLARTLAQRMDSSATLIIGDFDKEEAYTGDLLKKYGFVETKVENVFEKPKCKNIYNYKTSSVY